MGYFDLLNCSFICIFSILSHPGLDHFEIQMFWSQPQWCYWSNMEVRKDGDGEGQWSKTSSAPAHRTCSTGALVAFFFLILVFGVLGGLFMGESRCLQDVVWEDSMFCQWPALLPSAYLVQEQHEFMETVQLKGLKYDSALQSINSGYYIVLSSVIKNKVNPDSSLLCSPAWVSNHILFCFVLFSAKIWL